MSLVRVVGGANRDNYILGVALTVIAAVILLIGMLTGRLLSEHDLQHRQAATENVSPHIPACAPGHSLVWSGSAWHCFVESPRTSTTFIVDGDNALWNSDVHQLCWREPGSDDDHGDYVIGELGRCTVMFATIVRGAVCEVKRTPDTPNADLTDLDSTGFILRGEPGSHVHYDCRSSQ